MLATCAGDSRVHLHDLARDEAPARIFSQHFSRVKRLEVGDEAHMLWSAAEDGLILQMDLRKSDPEILVSFTLLLCIETWLSYGFWVRRRRLVHCSLLFFTSFLTQFVLVLSTVKLI